MALREALYAGSPRQDGRIPCLLCPKNCKIPEGLRGACGTRENRGGTLVASNYGLVAAIALDPIEKKPLYHFKPSSTILSLGAVGCNLSCSFCQNWELSNPPRANSPGSPLSPGELVALLGDYEGRNCIGVAYTYSEPLMWIEYILDAAPLVAEAGYSNVLVTNGYAMPGPWAEALEHIDACNIDVKGFDEGFYRRYCGGQLDVVMRNVEYALDAGVHVEITFLVIPDGTDDPSDVRKMVEWIAGLDPDIPLHIARYFPHHRMRRPATPMSTLLRVQETASTELNNVYLGNVTLPGGTDTFCPRCGNVLVERSGYRTRLVGLEEEGVCTRCGAPARVIL